MKEKVFIGISGGIDSAASVLLLKEQNYEVIGVYLQIIQPLENHKELEVQLGINIIICNVELEFTEKIVNNFISAYINGETPSPCTECNDKIKWQKIREIALLNGGKYWATGHYCQTEVIDGYTYVKRGIDQIKDQSYYLWKLDQEILENALFPLGEYTKQDIYIMMKAKGYDKLVEKPQSMSICFLKNKTLAEFLTKNISADIIKQGEIIDTNGNIIGKHNGYPIYTIAQKKSMGLPKNHCVIKINRKENKLITGHKHTLFCNSITISNWKFTNLNEVLNCKSLKCIVRGVGENPEGFAEIKIVSNTLAEVKLEYSAWAVTNGQPVVFYIDNRVVGGGYAQQ